MPARRRPRAKPSLERRLARLEKIVSRLTRAGVNVRRQEHDEVVAALAPLTTGEERNTRELEIQFKRIAQIQAELDDIKRAWERMKSGAA
jgi:hypothetical protein